MEDLDLRTRWLRIGWGVAVALAIILINAALPAKLAAPYPVEFIASSFNHMSLEQVRTQPDSEWQQGDPRQLSFLADGGREVWLRTKIAPSMTAEKWVAALSTPYIRQIDFYLTEAGQTTQTALLGMDRAQTKRIDNVAFPAFEFTPSASLDQLLYVRAYSEVNVYLPLQILTAAAFGAKAFVHNTLLGLLAGIFIGIVLYNLFICISLRDRVYAYYALYELGILLLNSMLSGQIHLIWPAASAFTFDVRFIALTSVATSIAFALFIQEFAALKQNDATANRLVMPFIALLLIMTLPIMIMPLYVMVKAVMTAVSLGLFALIIGTAARAKTRREFYLFFSFIGLGICNAIALATNLQLIGASVLSEYMTNIGCIWQALFLSLALAERISAMEGERKAIIRTLKGDGPASDLNSLLGTTFNRTHTLSEMNVSIMFIDIVGFSQLADILGSHKIYQHLARLMQDITVIVKECNGNVDRSLGDGVLCIFGYEKPGVRLRHHAQDAFAAAKRIQEGIVSRFQQPPLSGEHVLPLRIGIHVANVLLGDLGGTNRIDFTLIGSGVNFASRLETACSPFKIMLSAECLNHLPRNALDDQGFSEIMVTVKHAKELINAYEYDPFSAVQGRLEIVEKLHLNQLSRKTEDSRHVIIRGQPVHLTCTVAVFNLIDFSNQGFRVLSDTYVGRNVTLEIELRTFDGQTNAELEHLLLNKFYVEVRWSRKAASGSYEHGLKIAGLNEVQRDRVFNLVARLYAPADIELEAAQGNPI